MISVLLAAAASTASLATSQIAYNDLAGNLSLAGSSGDGAAQTYANSGSAHATAPSLSPDGRNVLALSSGDTQQLVLVPTTGAPPVPVTGTTGADSGALSPDGKQVVFSLGGDAPGIYTVAASGGTPKKVVATPDSATDSLPKFSPDGKQIAFVRQSIDASFNATSTIELVAATGGTVRDLTNDVTGTLSEGGALSFSPDGKTIVYAGDLGDPGIFTVSLAGGDAQQLTTEGDYWLTYSTDGSAIYFS